MFLPVNTAKRRSLINGVVFEYRQPGDSVRNGIIRSVDCFWPDIAIIDLPERADATIGTDAILWSQSHSVTK